MTSRTHARIHQREPKRLFSCLVVKEKDHLNKGDDKGERGEGWEGIRADEKEMTDTRVNASKINHQSVCNHTRNFSFASFLIYPRFLSPLHV